MSTHVLTSEFGCVLHRGSLAECEMILAAMIKYDPVFTRKIYIDPLPLDD